MSGPWENLPERPKPEPQRNGPSRLGWLLWLGALAALGLLLFLLDRWFPGARSGMDDAYMVQMLGFVALLSTGLLFVRRGDWRRVARNALLWLLAGVVLMVGYAYQEPLRDMALQVRAQLVPGYALETGPRELTIAESDGGHYLVLGTVNGARVRFLIDTGATNIVLSPSDARRAGIDIEKLRYNQPASTANGIGYGASVRLDSLAVGPIAFSNVQVTVLQTGMDASLLGMDFLRRLKSYAVQDRKLVLRW